VLYWAFALILAVGKLAFRRDFIAAVLRGIDMPAQAWTRVTWGWAAFLAVMGVLNLYVAFNFPTATWVNFKVWGATGLCLLFAVVQALFLARHVTDADASRN
jgi:intracellular septation protein